MIDKTILQKIQCGTCAIGYLRVSPAEYVKNPTIPSHFEIIGTGFLVRDNTIITNHHVLMSLLEKQEEEEIPENQLIVRFVYPRDGGWQDAFCFIKDSSYIDVPVLDVAFIDFRRRPEKEFEQCQPLEVINDCSSLFVSQEIAVLGYPNGSDMLVNALVDENAIYRFGPVLQRGYISALAPFDKNTPFTEILLDVRTTGGMSGSSVFDVQSGKVLGLHYAGYEPITALAIPLDITRLQTWLLMHSSDTGAKS